MTVFYGLGRAWVSWWLTVSLLKTLLYGMICTSVAYLLVTREKKWFIKAHTTLWVRIACFLFRISALRPLGWWKSQNRYIVLQTTNYFDFAMDGSVSQISHVLYRILATRSIGKEASLRKRGFNYDFDIRHSTSISAIFLCGKNAKWVIHCRLACTSYSVDTAPWRETRKVAVNSRLVPIQCTTF